MEQVRKFVEDFFVSLKCDVNWEVSEVGSRKSEVLIVNGVPKGFEDLVGKKGPYNLVFSDCRNKDLEFVGKGSRMLDAMRNFLKGSGKTTLLRIDFDIDAEAEIRKRVGLRNCEIESLTKGYRNNFFSRFNFVTSFNYLNESERVLNEVYVHEGKVVEGDLDGYTVVDGDKLSVDEERVKADYDIAKKWVVDLTRDKQEEIAEVLRGKVESEEVRIRRHYDKQLEEFGGDLNDRLRKIREVELELRGCEDEDRDRLRKRLERLKSGLVKVGDDEAVARVLKERDMTIRDFVQKYSLNVGRKLVNTTVIYYPVFNFRLFLKGNDDSSGRFVEMSYDPLTKSLSGLNCESCGKRLSGLSLCGGGHICCEECLVKCGECGQVFCEKCLKRSCKSCGKRLCKNCVKMCLGCGRVVCATHLRRDCVTGEDRCILCLRACLRCHGMTEERYFGEALDGSKVCSKCLGKEKRGEVLGRVFRG